MKKSDLRVGMKVILRDGSEGILKQKHFDDDEIDFASGMDMALLNEDLTNKGYCGEKYDIVKVEWKREETIEEMTLEEVCEELGREIKIKK